MSHLERGLLVTFQAGEEAHGMTLANSSPIQLSAGLMVGGKLAGMGE